MLWANFPKNYSTSAPCHRSNLFPIRAGVLTVRVLGKFLFVIGAPSILVFVEEAVCSARFSLTGAVLIRVSNSVSALCVTSNVKSSQRCSLSLRYFYVKGKVWNTVLNYQQKGLRRLLGFWLVSNNQILPFFSLVYSAENWTAKIPFFLMSGKGLACSPWTEGNALAEVNFVATKLVSYWRVLNDHIVRPCRTIWTKNMLPSSVLKS